MEQILFQSRGKIGLILFQSRGIWRKKSLKFRRLKVDKITLIHLYAPPKL